MVEVEIDLKRPAPIVTTIHLAPVAGGVLTFVWAHCMN